MELHTIIRAGFSNELIDVPRALFRQRVAEIERPDYIPLNFFLYNERRFGVDYVVVDEMVYQALRFRHSSHFDRLALFAFNLSRVGHWSRAATYQSRPALWAYHYVADRVGTAFDWDARRVNADDIEAFVSSDPRYTGQTSRKLATNLHYLYKVGRLADLRDQKPSRWWLSSLFLALDRMVNPAQIGVGQQAEASLNESLIRSGFYMISGKRSIAKDISATYFLSLYAACGGRSRFSERATQERQDALLPHMRPNDPAPPTGDVGVFHPVNPTSRNALPRICAVLAQYAAGFEVIEVEQLDDYDVEAWVRERTQMALHSLEQLGITPSLKSDELTQLMRGE